MNCDCWFHGTTPENADNIIECGVIADYNIGNQQLCNELKIVSVTEGGCDDESINNRE